jgi:hypothetical protein
MGQETKAIGKIENWSPSLNQQTGKLEISGRNGTFKTRLDESYPGETLGYFSQSGITWNFLDGTNLGTVKTFEQTVSRTENMYRTTWVLGVSGGSGLLNEDIFAPDLAVTGPTGMTSDTTGIIADWIINTGNTGGTLYVTNVVGSFSTGDNIHSSSGYAVINTCEPPELYFNSGELLYIQNMKPIVRGNEQREELQIILGF